MKRMILLLVAVSLLCSGCTQHAPNPQNATNTPVSNATTNITDTRYLQESLALISQANASVNNASAYVCAGNTQGFYLQNQLDYESQANGYVSQASSDFSSADYQDALIAALDAEASADSELLLSYYTCGPREYDGNLINESLDAIAAANASISNASMYVCAGNSEEFYVQNQLDYQNQADAYFDQAVSDSRSGDYPDALISALDAETAADAERLLSEYTCGPPEYDSGTIPV